MKWAIQQIRTALNEVNNSLSTDTPALDCIFNIYDVKSAVAMLKLHNNDGGTGFSTNYLVYAEDDCITRVSLLLTSIDIHGRPQTAFVWAL